ncbi:hypothetical protein Sato_gp01 [Bacillus phage Sato]|uniref:Uncharacterized protein n=1 Tax=Bacillus phage Sato TaxID=1260286 RepID=A0A8E8U3K4_9VIRU|nr:hypothetical protein QIS55_gp01 [Bacillus phage Sato]QWE49621.1 hypothetical protein Sato_gp01 [Bacillus phage Sato]
MSYRVYRDKKTRVDRGEDERRKPNIRSVRNAEKVSICSYVLLKIRPCVRIIESR